jgi:hypothetical protein
VADRNQHARFVALYLVAAAVVGAVASGGAGSDVNYFFDLIIAASLGTALAVEMLWSGSSRSGLFGVDSKLRLKLGPIAIVLLGICTASYAVTKVPRELAKAKNMDLLEKTSLNYISQIRSQGHGRAVCETVGLCYWAKSSFVVDLFIYGQKMETGAMPIASCQLVFQATTVPMIQLQTVDRRGVELLPQKCSRVIDENYRPIAESDLGVLLVPARTAN